MNRKLTFVVGLCLASLMQAQGSGSQVWIVDGAGGGDFLDLQPAIDAAAPGDAIRLRYRPTPYSTAYLDKTLTIVGEGPQRVPVGEIWLRFAHDVVLRQLSIEPTGTLSATALLVDSSGGVWIEDCEVRPAVERNSSILVSYGRELVLVRTDVFGSTVPLGLNIDAGLGLSGTDVHAYDCLFVGSNRPVSLSCTLNAGGPGASVGNGSFLYAANTTFRGGRGSQTNGVLCSSGAGGAGAFVSCSSELQALGGSFVGGFGGRGPAPGPTGAPIGTPFCVWSVPIVETGAAPVRRSALTPSVVAGGATAELEVEGVGGDVLFSLFSTERTAQFLPLFLGTLAVDAPYTIVAEGVLPPNGRLSRSFLPAPPGAGPLLLFHQGVFFEVAGQVTLGSPSAILVAR